MKDADREAWTKQIIKAEMQRSIDRTARKSKYNAVKKTINGRTFDSTKEANRSVELAMLQAAKQISDLQFQPEFPLTVNGVDCGVYRADFSYLEGDVRVIEDVKSKATATPVYRLKKKLVFAIHGVVIREV